MLVTHEIRWSCFLYYGIKVLSCVCNFQNYRIHNLLIENTTDRCFSYLPLANFTFFDILGCFYNEGSRKYSTTLYSVTLLQGYGPMKNSAVICITGHLSYQLASMSGASLVFFLNSPIAFYLSQTFQTFLWGVSRACSDLGALMLTPSSSDNTAIEM